MSRLTKNTLADALAAMKGICSNPESPTDLPDALSQLTDILGNVFDDLTLPEFPRIDSGEFGLPEDAPFDFPLGGGSVPSLDPLDGFKGGSPGGGGGGEDGGGGGGGEGEGGPCGVSSYEETRHVTFLAKAKDDIPAAKNGNPGKGDVKIMAEVTRNNEQQSKCADDCASAHKQDKEEAEELLRNVRFAVKDRDFTTSFGHLGATRGEAMDTVRTKIAMVQSLWNQCLNGCEDDPDPEGPQETECEAKVKNISCEKIEKDTQIIVSGEASFTIELDGNGNPCEGDPCPIPNTEDLYVIVEACGCCEDED